MLTLKKFTSGFLLAVFALIITPAELIHEFHGHDETQCHPGNFTTIEKQHSHCKLLQIEAQVFTSPEEFLSTLAQEIPSPIIGHQTEFPFLAAARFANLRAPPEV